MRCDSPFVEILSQPTSSQAPAATRLVSFATEAVDQSHKEQQIMDQLLEVRDRHRSLRAEAKAVEQELNVALGPLQRQIPASSASGGASVLVATCPSDDDDDAPSDTDTYIASFHGVRDTLHPPPATEAREGSEIWASPQHSVAQRQPMDVTVSLEEVESELAQLTPRRRAALDAEVARLVPEDDGQRYLEDALLCPIRQEVISEPATLFGHVFEKSAITEWVRQSHTCPISRAPATLADIHVSYGADSMKDALVKACKERVATERTLRLLSLMEKQISERKIDAYIQHGNAQEQERARSVQQALLEKDTLIRKLTESAKQQKKRLEQQERLAKQSEVERTSTVCDLLNRKRKLEKSIRQTEKEKIGLQAAMIQFRVYHLTQQSSQEFNQAGLAAVACVGCGKFFTYALVNPHACSRCKRVYCHACCHQIGALPNPPPPPTAEGDVSQREEAGRPETPPSPPEPGETLSPEVLKNHYTWFRICSQCYTECLHTRKGVTVDEPMDAIDNEVDGEVSTAFALGGTASRALTDPHVARTSQLVSMRASRPQMTNVFRNSLPMYYVLTPDERRYVVRCVRGEAVTGLAEEAAMLPHFLSETFHSTAVCIRDEWFPMIAERTSMMFNWIKDRVRPAQPSPTPPPTN